MIEKRTYDTAALRDAIGVYERHYEMSSVDFLAAHQADDQSVMHIPGHQRSVWASMWQEIRDDGDLAGHVCRSLELV